VEIFREVRRVLRSDGTLWLNLGDCFSPQSTHKAKSGRGGFNQIGRSVKDEVEFDAVFKEKDLVGIPWMSAFALRADGWYLRSEIIWSKTNCMPDSTEDRPTRSHENFFLLTKSANYFYDNVAVKEPSVTGDLRNPHGRGQESIWGRPASGARMSPIGGKKPSEGTGRSSTYSGNTPISDGKRNLRSVWTIPTSGFDLEVCEACGKMYETGGFRKLRRRGETGAEKVVCQCGRDDAWLSHFAVFPPALVEIPIKAGASEKGCCAKCGSPWVRIVEKTDEPDTRAKGSRFDVGKTGARDGGDRTQPGERFLNRAVGWKPSCNCPGLDGDHPGSDCADEDNWPSVPCVVMDPFAGTGTVLAVALGLGRSAIGFDASEKYVKNIAATRVEAARRGLTVTETQAGQRTLFDGMR
jgi:hypothetical protein